MVVRAADVADVIAAVRPARDHDLLLAVRGGGHSIAGFSTCDRGMVLDLGALRGIRIDPATRTVRAVVSEPTDCPHSLSGYDLQAATLPVLTNEF